MPQRKSRAMASKRAKQIKSAKANTEKFMGKAQRVQNQGKKLPTKGGVAKAGASSAAKALRVAGRVATPVAVAATGFEVGKAVGRKMKESSQKKKVASMAKASFEKNKAARVAKATKGPSGSVKQAITGERLKQISTNQPGSGRAGTSKKAPANSKPMKQTPKPRAANTGASKAPVNKANASVRADSGKRKPAKVQSGPTRKPVMAKKAKKRSRNGYSNYERIMKDVGG